MVRRLADLPGVPASTRAARSVRDHGLVSLNCPSVIPFQRLNARWNAEGSENPISAAVSWIVRFGSLSICVARISSTDWTSALYDTPSSASRRRSERALSPRSRATRAMSGIRFGGKILLSAARLYGIDVVAPARPHVALRTLVSSIAILPDFLARPLTLAGEMIGVLVFLQLLEAARTVLKSAPAVRDAVEDRLIEILIDEIGHVSFQRLSMGRTGLALTRAILPIVARGLAGAVPEVRALGAIPHAPVEAITSLARRGLPETVRRNAFLA
jgi:hypothetical protein